MFIVIVSTYVSIVNVSLTLKLVLLVSAGHTYWYLVDLKTDGNCYKDRSACVFLSYRNRQ